LILDRLIVFSISMAMNTSIGSRIVAMSSQAVSGSVLKMDSKKEYSEVQSGPGVH